MLQIPQLLRPNQASATALIRTLVSQNKRLILQEVVFSDDLDKPYGRKVLFQNDQIELLLTGWNPGHACWPHTHGGDSEGVVLVLSGEGTFKTFPDIGNINRVKTALMSDGNIIYVPQREVHSMGNYGSKPLVCLHLYWPPIEEMWIYNPDQTMGWRVSKGGAWQPEQQHTLEERKIEHAS